MHFLGQEVTEVELKTLEYLIQCHNACAPKALLTKLTLVTCEALVHHGLVEQKGTGDIFYVIPAQVIGAYHSVKSKNQGPQP